MSIRSKNLIIKEHKEIQNNIYEITFIGDDFSDVNFGQFINLKIQNKYLRRPISVMDVSKDELKICYKVLGDGTKILSDYKVNDKVDCLYPLGQGFELPENDQNNILILAGGIGVPPLVGWFKHLNRIGNYNIKVILGFRDKDQAIYENEFSNLEISYDNVHQNIIEYLYHKDYLEKYKNHYVYSCGAMPMLNKIALDFPNGQMLLEERMGCGFGACMGCVKKINEHEYKRVCKEGPMFYNKEVLYEAKS